MRAVKTLQSSNGASGEDIPKQEPTFHGTARESGESRVDGNILKRAKKECETDYKTPARREIKVVKALRVS
jgi:hypothetical protein